MTSNTVTSRPYVRDVLALGVGIAVFGMTFGVVATAMGATVLQTVAISLLTFTGASQFAVVGVLAAGGSPAAALGSALLLAARNTAYGLALSRLINGSLPRRLLAAHFVLDETTAMAMGQTDTKHVEGAFWTTGIVLGTLWNVGTLVGALSGQAIGDPEALGLDVAFSAGFLALLAPQLRRPEGRAAAVAGGLVALAALPFTPPGVPVLLAILGAVPGYVVARRNAA